MPENKLADLSMNFAVEILNLCKELEFCQIFQTSYIVVELFAKY